MARSYEGEEEGLRRTMWFSFCVPLGVASGARKLLAPLRQLVLEGDLRAGKEIVAWLSCSGQCSLCDMAALWPPFCSILAPEWMPRCLLELGSPVALFLPTLRSLVSSFFCFISPPPTTSLPKGFLVIPHLWWYQFHIPCLRIDRTSLSNHEK